MNPGDHPAAGRRVARRAIIVAVVLAQLVAIVAAYGNDHRQFGWQMFPESSRWTAEITRVEADGTVVPVDEDWEYRWADLVAAKGIGNPDRWRHANSGLRSQLAYLQAALDWVAQNTPDDTTTRVIQADVTYRDNGRGPFTRVLRSQERPLP
ncbi:MAG: hypothetical protein RIE08_16400 [Acidimicrobiales bacterium]